MMLLVHDIDCVFFFFNDTATTEIYTLSLHDALPIWTAGAHGLRAARPVRLGRPAARAPAHRTHAPDPRASPESGDRKSTRLNSSHANISYAVFCLKKKKQLQIRILAYV